MASLWQIPPSQLPKHHNKILEKLETSNNVAVIYFDFAKVFDKVKHGILMKKLKKSESVVKSVCGYKIFYQTENSVLQSMEQHQVKLKSEVAYPKGQCTC